MKLIFEKGAPPSQSKTLLTVHPVMGSQGLRLRSSNNPVSLAVGLVAHQGQDQEGVAAVAASVLHPFGDTVKAVAPRQIENNQAAVRVPVVPGEGRMERGWTSESGNRGYSRGTMQTELRLRDKTAQPPPSMPHTKNIPPRLTSVLEPCSTLAPPYPKSQSECLFP